MGDLKVFAYGEQQVRTVLVDDAPWWVLADVCKALDIANTTDALNRLDDDEKARLNLGLCGGATNCVNEPGLYSLVLGSRKPEARAFKRWITHDVVPSIRKTGGYALPKDYPSALRACLRQAPDVILLGEMRDLDTIQTAMTAAETGHLVISTLHTVGAVNTIDRIIDVFPPAQQQQIRIQLAQVLKTVISQQLLHTTSGGLVPAFEIMHLNNAVRTLVRDSRIHQIDSVIQTSAAEGMIAMDESILRLYKAGRITTETALHCAMNPDQLQKKLGK